ncbi:sulfurtransferase TusA family protein [Sphingomonas bacterium]|uniref:sulfurtransferase TusA family protein n=1 Tax=Sphingomonas bacterium TaxID=1895847 RepID=UPI00266FEC74|nr:sulfurtransferase TusA family protein [Sphingomonas bacterium]
MTESIVDARGMRCPWPALRLARAMRESPAVTILADDPAAPAEIAALADHERWEVSPIMGGFIVRRSPWAMP